MIIYFLKRILLLIPVILLVSFIVFALMDMAPGDTLSTWDLSDMSEEEVAELRANLGIDDALIVRYGRYLFRLIQGDLGVSDRSGIRVWDTYTSRLPNTLILAFSAFIIGVAVSIPPGVIAARRAGKITDNIITGVTMIGMSVPGFWLGILLILLFSYQLGWFPAAGFNDGFRSVVLPAVCSATILVATATRQTRSSMLEVLKADYLRTARAKGVPEKVVVRKHALGNAMIPIVTTVGLSLGHAISGTAIIEAVFAWPGVGRLVVESVNSRDVTATTGTVILTTILYVLVLLAVDIVYAIIDPRIKAQYSNAGKRWRRDIKRAKKNLPKHQTGAISVEADLVTKDTNDCEPSAENMTPSQADRAIPEQTPEQAPEQSTGQTPVQTSVQTPERTGSAGRSFVTRGVDFAGIRTKNNEAALSADSVRTVDLSEEQAGELTATGKNAAQSGELITRRYRKRSQIGEIFHRLSRNPGAITGLVIISALVILFFVSLFIPFESVTAANVQDRFSPPGAQYIFGTDGMGRNLFIRVVYAARFSLPIGLGATSVAAIIGVILGSLAAYYGKTIDEIIMRFSDTLASTPSILLGMVIITTLGRSLTNLIIAVGVTSIPTFIRITRAAILSIKDNEFVEAAHAIGLPNFRIIFAQILPNGLAPIIITFTTSLGLAILISASLSFLGYGIPVPNPEWGSLVSAGRDNIRNAPWLTTFPGLFIMITVMAFNLLGDGLRDALDPKLKRR